MDNRECHEVKVELANYGNAFCQDCLFFTLHCYISLHWLGHYYFKLLDFPNSPSRNAQ